MYVVTSLLSDSICTCSVKLWVDTVKGFSGRFIMSDYTASLSRSLKNKGTIFQRVKPLKLYFEMIVFIEEGYKKDFLIHLFSIML